jgi:hypothetical protein
LPSSNPIRLQSGAASRPKGEVIDHNPDARPFLMHLGDFRRIGFAPHRSVAKLIMSDVVPPDAPRHEVKCSLVPDGRRLLAGTGEESQSAG